MPLRNQELVKLVGRTCVAVVYDSDISMNYEPIYANLQGERYGLFSFHVNDVQVPYRLPEAQSDNSLYELCMDVLPPQEPGLGLIVDIHDHEPDSIAIVRARWSNGTLTIRATSDFAPGSALANLHSEAVMTVSVDEPDGIACFPPFILEEPVPHVSGNRYILEFDTPVDLRGRHVSIQTDEGGSYNAIIN